MDFLWNRMSEWLKELLISGITSNLTGLFDATNEKVSEISGQVGLTPQAWNGSIFNMVRNLSETVVIPIAGLVLAFVMTLERRWNSALLSGSGSSPCSSGSAPGR